MHYRQFFDFYSAVATCQNAIKHIFKKHLHQKKGNATQCCTAFMIFFCLSHTVFVKCVNTLKHNFPKAFALKNQFNATLHYRQFFDFYSAVCNVLKYRQTHFQKTFHKKRQCNVMLHCLKITFCQNYLARFEKPSDKISSNFSVSCQPMHSSVLETP